MENNNNLFEQAKKATPVNLTANLEDMAGNTQDDSFMFETPKPIEQQPTQNIENELPPPPQEQRAKNTLNGSFINEEFVVMVADNLVSFAGSYALTKIFKVEVLKKELKLEAGEKKQAEMIAAEILKTANIDISNPYVALAIWAVSVYVPKVATIIEQKAPEIAEYKRKVESGEIQEGETAKKKETRGRPRKNK